MSSTRANQHPWVTAYEAAPPAACATLRNLANTVEWGVTCVFGEEDGDPLPNSINAACLPWATSGQASGAFYSPATACPTSWSAVATRTAASGSDSGWVDGETALECCPEGFVGGTGGLCNPEGRGTTRVVKCGEADAEENSNEVYTAGRWPASATARVTALQLRYQASDVGLSAGASATASGSGSTSSSSSSPGLGSGGSGGLSTGAKAAIGTVIPLVFVVGALAAFLLWRRRKHRKQAAGLSKDFTDGHETKRSYEAVAQSPYNDSKSVSHASPVAAATAPTASIAAAAAHGQHETPEWNAELDATEAERRRYMAVQGSLFPGAMSGNDSAASPGGASEASELGGMMRMNRKPVAPVELDSKPLVTEMDGRDGGGR